MEPKYFENKYPTYSESSSLHFFKNIGCNEFKLNEVLENRMLSTIAQLVDKMDNEYEASDGFRDHDYSVYVGNTGQALFYHTYYLKTQNTSYLEKSERLIYRCLRHLKKKRFSFLNGDSGSLAVGALIYETAQKQEKSKECVEKLKALLPHIVDLSSDIPDEILYGRAGYLYSLLFVNKYLKNNSIQSSVIRQVVESILKSGQALSDTKSSKIPLMYEWHDKNYYGAAHGVAGILYTLLKANSHLTTNEREKLIKPTLGTLLSERFPSGNLRSSQGSNNDRLVQWCHGSPGLVSLLEVAFEVFGDNKYKEAIIKASDNIWRYGLLRKGYSLCHGVAGNGYSFINAYHVTKDVENIYRALCYADWCTSHNEHEEMDPDRPFSLYEGMVGVALFLLDMLHPIDSKFPGYGDV